MREPRIISIPGLATVAIAVSVFGLIAQSCRGINGSQPVPEDAYLGQVPPGENAEPFAPGVLSLEPHDTPVISRDETWIVIHGMDVDVVFYRMVAGRLASASNPLGFDIPDLCNGVAISPREDRVYLEEWKDGRNQGYYIDR